MSAEAAAEAQPGAALVLVAKWPGSGAAKTRLASQLAAGVPNPADAQRWAGAFVRAAVLDLVARFGVVAPVHLSLIHI